MLVAALIALQTANTGFLTRQVLAFDVPPYRSGRRRPAARPAGTSARPRIRLRPHHRHRRRTCIEK